LVSEQPGSAFRTSRILPSSNKISARGYNAALRQLEDSSDSAVFTRIKIQQAVEKLKTIPVIAQSE